MREMTSRDNTSGIEQLQRRGWISLNQFAKLIGVSYPTALKMRKRGQIVTQRVGSVWRVYTSEVRRFMIEGNANQPSELQKLADHTGRKMPRTTLEGEGDPTLSPFHNPYLKAEDDD